MRKFDQEASILSKSQASIRRNCDSFRYSSSSSGLPARLFCKELPACSFSCRQLLKIMERHEEEHCCCPTPWRTGNDLATTTSKLGGVSVLSSGCL